MVAGRQVLDAVDAEPRMLSSTKDPGALGLPVSCRDKGEGFVYF